MESKPLSVQDWINKISTCHTQEKEFYFITNTDKSIRWIWPIKNKKPIFLKFYSNLSLKSKAYALFVKLLFKLKLQKIIAKKGVACFDFFPSEFNIDSSKEWAIFTGTIGPNRKIIVFGEDHQGTQTFTKIAINDHASSLISNEYKNIQYLKRLNLQFIRIPKIKFSNQKSIQLSDVSTKNRSNSLSELHHKGLKELTQKTQSKDSFRNTTIYQNTVIKFSQLKASNHSKLPKAMIRKIEWLSNKIDYDKKINLNFAHGDFTPWNCYSNHNSISLYDFELSQENMPQGYDAFHFIIQKGILIDRNSWIEILEDIQSQICPRLFNGNEHEMKEYLKYYFFINTIYYLNIYSQQTTWHTQIEWLINTWNDALSYLLNDGINTRKLILMDVFDFIQNKNYSTLKFNSYLPEQVSPMSDIDLCILKSDSKHLLNFVKNHSLVKMMNLHNQSFMKNASLVLKNNDLLSIDCIWKLKRKNLIIHDISTLINQSFFNAFGVRKANVKDEFEYVNKFYTINKSTPPNRYYSRSFELKLQNISPNNSLKSKQNILKKILRNRPENNGLNYIINTINYGLDTIRNLAHRRGFIVTFSGVDGAGKSTLIEITKNQINKQLRKPVVILRHRPSLLPIISAWKYGKVSAEKKATSNLPRQGKNQSLLSSIIRFSYYYIDYFWGQFYIYFKYTLRGKIVLYDRYYFDFMNDSKRSNIKLPNWIAHFGYKLLLKPAINFFLYADPETILTRKKELDKDTIQYLNYKYLKLFKRLDHSENQTYCSIKNTELNTTVDTIMRTLKSEAT